MTSSPLEGARRRLSGRRPEMTTRLVDAVAQVIAVTGYDGLTVRAVAKAAGVSAASAYNYFASKEHLLAEVYWRRLSALPPVEVGPTATPGERMRAAVEPVVLSVAEEPELAAGVTTALLAHDPDVRAVRDQVGNLMAKRLDDALGAVVPAEALTPLVFMLTGGLLNAGMGYLEYSQVAEEMATFADAMAWKRKRS
jgi:TetR/AcrR family transcriptional regulator, cholesterol catabolism regulator